MPPRTDLDVKTGVFDFEMKSIDDQGRFSAYFAAFGNVDRGGDVIEPGAFRNLDEFARDGWIGINHQMERLPVAYPTRVVQDAKGLLIDGQFHTTEEAQACRTVVLERVRAGKRVKGSIGYRTGPSDTRQEYVDGRQVRRIRGLDLYEASFVNLPMNPAADVVSAKSLTDEGGPDVAEKIVTIEALKSWLDVQAKAGRVLSKNNHGKLKAWHGTLATMCSEMKSLVDQYDPSKLPDDGDEPDADDKATIPPSPPLVPKEVDPRRSAGNSIPGDRGIGGAATAENRKSTPAELAALTADEARERIRKNLEDMRARAVRVQTQFALMR